ncbi:TPA: glycosyltransferase family 2 protein [Candidatus Gastranaerophilales bacterium HUM_20]|nr:glycosyl transferase group 2 family protein [Clostridium sp. CAG:729]DAB22455.1 MAG TPA: glycosyltransferase family 2 protein [Candidatus Gastranaerophilales bacterium HUM_20]
MKLVIQIPCYNEEKSLPVTLADLPKHINGVDEIEVLIINDGSTDKTVQTAKEHGIKHIVEMPHNCGLAKAFVAGINSSLALGADIIVNTDADNQYCASDIEKLIQPILNSEADIVIGSRPVSQIEHFSPLKKLLQKLGSCVMRMVSSTSVEDAPSGFRAFSRNAALQLNVFDNYTYTLETIIQARAKGLQLVCVPISVNPDLRESKLVKNMFDYIRRSVFTMLRMFIIYRPFRFFSILAGLFLFIGMLIGARFLWYYMGGNGTGHIQSLILSAILIITGVQVGVIGVLSELLAINRKLLEDIQRRLKLQDLKKK